MRKLITIGLILSFVSLGACVGTPQQPISLASDFYSSQERKVGIYENPMPKVTTHFIGAGCLLCIGVAEAAHSSLTKQIHTLDSSELEQLKSEIVSMLEENNVNVKIIDEEIKINKLGRFSSKEPNYAKKDFRSLSEKYSIDSLIVLDFHMLGVNRPYSSYVPTGDPVGVVKGSIYMVNLETNQYELYETLDLNVAVQGEWKEEPDYPGVTSAYFQALELAKEKVKNLFK